MKTGLYIALTVVGVLILVAVINLNAPPSTPQRQVPYSTVLNDLEQGKVRQVTISGNQINALLNNGERYISYAPSDQQLIERLHTKGVSIMATPPEEPVSALVVLVNWLPFLLYLGSLWLIVGRPLRRIERRLDALVRPSGNP
jgi:cell division protease FtsH